MSRGGAVAFEGGTTSCAGGDASGLSADGASSNHPVDCAAAGVVVKSATATTVSACRRGARASRVSEEVPVLEADSLRLGEVLFQIRNIAHRAFGAGLRRRCLPHEALRT